jgi:hypothetical protein
MIRRHCLPFSCETRLYFSPSCIPSLLCATAWHPPCTKAKGNRVWQTECLETFHPLNITSRTCESTPPLYFEMSALFRPMGPRIARQNQLQPGALQRTAFSSRLQSRRSMATNKGNLKDDEELNAMMRIPAHRSFFLDSKTGRAIATRAKQFRTMQHEQLWEKVKRAEKQLSISIPTYHGESARSNVFMPTWSLRMHAILPCQSVVFGSSPRRLINVRWYP